MNIPSVSGAGGIPVDPQEQKLRKAAADLQGLFVQQLYKTMRASVPTDGGIVEQSQGEEVFAGLMDERLAADTGTRWHRGLGDAIYRALRTKAGLDEASAAPSAAPIAEAPTTAPTSAPTTAPTTIAPASPLVSSVRTP
jgi:flagellar protein FlgJ